MTNAQRPNKHRRNKTNSSTTRKGARGNRRLNHGSGKSNQLVNKSQKRLKG